MISNYKKINGFTLIELVVTMVIAAILVSIAVPSMLAMIRNNRLSAATNEFVSSMYLARSEAIKRRADISVTATGGVWNDGWTVAQGATTIKTVKAIPDTSIAMTGTATSFTYSANGMSNISGAIAVCIDNKTDGRQVTVETTGRTTLNSNYSSCP